MFRRTIVAAVAVAASLALASSALAYSNSVAYKGQGLTHDGSAYVLNNELCGVENGADVDGPYLLFVMTATGAQSADITINGTTYPMVKSGNGTFKYVSTWIDPDVVNQTGYVTGTYDGKAKNTQLVVSHGCRPFKNEGAWCSPGYWGHNDDDGWALVGAAKTDPFNGNVSQAFYGADLLTTPTLNTVLLTTGGTYKGPGLAGTDPRTQPSNPALNPFNATGAYLTDKIPGFTYDPAIYVKATTTGEGTYDCPIDNHGNFKQPTV